MSGRPKGDGVTLLNRWLIQGGVTLRLAGRDLRRRHAARWSATRRTTACRRTGIADIAMLLSLYAKIDDGDATLPGA